MVHLFCYVLLIKKGKRSGWVRRAAVLPERRKSMKGFTTSTGYMGWVEDRYILFASEYDYREYMEE